MWNVDRENRPLLLFHPEGFPFQLFRLLDLEQAPHVHSIPPCMRDELTHAFIQQFPTVADGQKVQARAVIESLALSAEVDISRIECGHATVREYTLQRGRGHFTNLVDVSAMLLCRFIGKLLKATSGSRNSSGETEDPLPTEPRGRKRKQTSGNTPNPKKRGGSGHGGPWHAFLADVAKGVQLNRRSLGRFSQMYHELTHDEFERYREIGLVATLAAREGVKKPFALPGHTSTSAEPDSENPLKTTLALLNSSHQDVLVALEGEGFEERYQSFKKQLSHDRLDVLKRKKEREDKSQTCIDSARGLVKHNSSRVRQALSTEAYDIPHHFSYAASETSSLQQMEWVPPATQFARVPWPGHGGSWARVCLISIFWGQSDEFGSLGAISHKQRITARCFLMLPGT